MDKFRITGNFPHYVIRGIFIGNKLCFLRTTTRMEKYCTFIRVSQYNIHSQGQWYKQEVEWYIIFKIIIHDNLGLINKIYINT